MSDFRKNFPYDSVRVEQETAVEFALNTLVKSNKKFAILELGTGCGKSGVGLTVSRCLEEDLTPNVEYEPGSVYAPGGYFITTQKVLQEQYVLDFTGRGKMKSIKSSSNYSCTHHTENNCSESSKLLKVEPKDSKFYKNCMFSCKYKKAKEEFLASTESVTNFPYFMTEANYAGKIKPRQILVIDEAHNVEMELSKFIEVTISENFAERILKIPFGDVETQHQAMLWIKDVYLPKVADHCTHIEMMLLKYKGLQDKLKELLNLSRQIEMLTGHRKKIETFIKVYDKENWVMSIISSDTMKNAGRKLEFKVIDVSPFSEQYLFRLGQKVVMMSATILNKESFCESLGIPLDQAEFISIPSPFPVENRPIFYAPVGKMGKDNIDKTLPNLIAAIKAILDSHPNEKGIIHAHTYKIANYIKKNIKNNRLVIHDSNNRDEILKKHISDSRPTVIISPSMTEGVDLKDDASRFQIVCKIPFPYLGDKLVKKRTSKWKWWYSTQTVKIIVQGVGRSIRTMEDHAVTYILDEDWGYFYSKNKETFPKEFRDAISKV